MEARESSNAQNNLNTVLGSLGTAGFAGINLGNLFGMNRPPMEPPATQRDLTYEGELREKDAKIGKLEAQLYTDQQINNLRQEVNTGFARLDAKIDAVASTQAIFNTQTTSSLDILRSTVGRIENTYGTYIRPSVMQASEAAMSYRPTTTQTSSASTGA